MPPNRPEDADEPCPQRAWSDTSAELMPNAPRRQHAPHRIDHEALAFESFDHLAKVYRQHGQHFIAALGLPDGRVMLGSTQRPEQLATVLRGMADQLDGGSGGALIHLGFREPGDDS